MRVLVVGGGGREHALCWFLARSATVFCAPGNPGTALSGTNLPIDIRNHRALAGAVRGHHIDFVLVGPEAPLAAGLVDDLAAEGIAAFGPTAGAARIESSKAFAKEIMSRAGVPTARSRTFSDPAAATRYIHGHPEPVVVKASGLAAGKGAVVCDTRAEARATAQEMLGGRFGDAGREIVVEEFLAGEELSVLALTDGERTLVLPGSQDHKRLGDGDKGPNTGGMGAYAPVSFADAKFMRTVETVVLQPTLSQLAREGTPYRGVLYAGLMVSSEGRPSVIEFNCRLGDPETQAVLPVLQRGLEDDFWAIAKGENWRPAPVTASRSAVTTVLAARGYPDAPKKGAEITIPSELPENALLFHAGTATAGGVVTVAGGRVLSATGLGPDLRSAGSASLALADAVKFEGKVYRRDIGWREAARARAS